MENNLIEKAKAFVTEQFGSFSSEYVYHNLKHTEQVVAAIKSLSETFQLKHEDNEALELAAWFHDISYATDRDDHETKSAEVAKQFLQKESVDELTIQKVQRIILATKMHYKPLDFLEMIMRDADSAHLGKKNMPKRASLLRMEWQLTQNEIFTDLEWAQKNEEFLAGHQYYTTIAQSEWEPLKAKHLKQIRKTIKAQSPVLSDVEEVDAIPEINIKNEKANRRSRGVETMFRVTLRNHINLSRIADNKANFLLSISAIILSLLLGNLITDNKPVMKVLLPSIYFLIWCVITMVLAILAARPNITKGKFSRDGLIGKETNLLFFGNFHSMPKEEFHWGMNQLMENDELLYHSLTTDLYYLGKVLDKKYRLLRWGFNVFMIGIISSAIFYIIMLML